MRDRQSTPDTKSQHSQPTKERETQRTTAQEDALVTQQDPLVQTISRMGSPPSAKVHANLLSRATSDYPARGRQLMLQMQRQYGNRYVQRVVELSRQGLRETEATPEVEATIEQTRGGGRSLDAGIQRQMESAFGTNFSEVRVHTDSTADALNQSLSARAFTTGQDIFFRQGEYNPGSSSGKELLAHELTHVVQQTGTVRGKLAIGEAGDRYEQEADKVASEVLQRLDAPASVQRQEALTLPKSLENEADLMSARSLTAGLDRPTIRLDSLASIPRPLQGKFFEKTGTTYVWHNEDPDDRYHRLPETRRYYDYGVLNPLNMIYGGYPVYTRQAVDRSHNPVHTADWSDEETQKLRAVFAAIQNTPYEGILNYIEHRIIGTLGVEVLAAFSRGAHIIFNDNGQVYRDLFDIAAPVAKLRPQTWGEWFWGTEVETTPENLAPSSKGGAGMGARRPERRETSHYTADALPQLGIDLPNPLTGHILIGRVPPARGVASRAAGHTFIQTEMYGFKTVYDHYIGHVEGFFWNFVASYQSGLVGYCKYSEKKQMEIREQDNPHKSVVQGKFVASPIFAAPLQLKSRQTMQAAPRPVLQRKISFDDESVVLDLKDNENAKPRIRQQ